MSTTSATSSLETGRLHSVDVFRGATIVAMIIVNAEYAPNESYRQLAHAAWDGWTFADTIFPCFLFIVGISLTLSVTSRLSCGQGQVHLLAHAVLRALLFFACGVAIHYVRFPTHDFP